MFLLLSLASSAALLAPGPGRRGVPRLLESSTTARSSPLMNQTPTGPAGEAANAGSAVNALQCAITQGHDVEVKKALVEAGASLDAAVNGFTPLQLAISLGNIDTIKASIETKASLEAACGFHAAAAGGKQWGLVICHGHTRWELDAMKMLVEAGAPLEAAGELDLTAFELAMHLGNVNVIKALIQGGGSLEAVECGSELTAMEFAIDNGLDVEVIEVLIEAGASPEAVDKSTGSTLSSKSRSQRKR